MRHWLRILPRLALRNVARQARRSTLTAAAMVIGVGLLMMSRALADGIHEGWIEAAVRLGSGHIALQAPGYLESRRIEDRLTERAPVERALEHPDVAPHIVATAPRLATSGLASSAAAARPIQITGVDPASERHFSRLDGKLQTGRYLQADDRLHAYIGAELAENLDLELGSRLVLQAQDATGTISAQLVRVVGIFRTGIPEADGGIVHIPLSTAQSWLGVGDDLTTVAILLDSSLQVPELATLLRSLLSPERVDGQFAVRTWHETQPQLEAGLRLDDYGDYVFHAILLAIVALAIVNTVLMSVLYRTREFGLLQALGLTPHATALLVLIEGLMLTAVSGLLGVAAGLGITWGFWRDGLDLSFLMGQGDLEFSGVIVDPVFIPEFRVDQVLLGLGLILLIGTLASLYPAYRATRIRVAEAMTFER